MTIEGWAVRKKTPDGWAVLSAWPDIYSAKFEAQRWEQDLKLEHDYVSCSIELGEKDGDQDSAHT